MIDPREGAEHSFGWIVEDLQIEDRKVVEVGVTVVTHFEDSKLGQLGSGEVVDMAVAVCSPQSMFQHSHSQSLPQVDIWHLAGQCSYCTEIVGM